MKDKISDRTFLKQIENDKERMKVQIARIVELNQKIKMHQYIKSKEEEISGRS